MARSIWNGWVGVGDLRVAVKLFGAVADRAVRFREVHLKDGAPIEHRRVDAESGREVGFDHIVKGFPTGDGSYVVLSDEEVRTVDGPAGKLVALETFVPADQVDPVYYEKPYHLGPREGADAAYRLLHDALARTGRVGIGRIVLRTRERLVAVRSIGDGVLGLSTVRFADEVVAPASFDVPAAASAPGRREREMAAALVEQLSAPFDATAYRDEHRKALLALVRRKAEGEAIEPPPAEPAEAPDDLAGALEQTLRSLRSGRRRRARGGRRPARAGRRGRSARSSSARSRRRAARARRS
jgi:DNA end-binding protein Ku